MSKYLGHLLRRSSRDDRYFFTEDGWDEVVPPYCIGGACVEAPGKDVLEQGPTSEDNK